MMIKRFILACLVLTGIHTSIKAGITTAIKQLPNTIALKTITFIKEVPNIIQKAVALRLVGLAKYYCGALWGRFLRTQGLDEESLNADARSAASASQNRLPELVTEDQVHIADGTAPAAICERIARLRRGDYSWPTCKPILLTGLPGCGKTQLGKYLAQQTGCPHVYESAAGIYGGFENSATEIVNGLFNRARRRPLLSSLVLNCRKLWAWMRHRPQPVRKPAVITLDEFDAIGETAPQDQVIAGDRSLEVERDKAFNRLLWEIARNPHKEVQPGRFPTWINTLPRHNIMRLIFQESRDLANQIPHYSCPPADTFEKTLATITRSPVYLANMLERILVRSKNGRKLSEAERKKFQEIVSQVVEFLPPDAIIPLTHVFFATNTMDDALAKAPPGRFTSWLSWQNWFMKKYHRLVYWLQAKDETDALVIATSNKRPDQLDPLIHNYFEVIEMRPLNEDQRLRILDFHAQDKRLAQGINLRAIAEDTQGFTGDELAAIINDAALEAAGQNQQEITQTDIDTSFAALVQRKEQEPHQEQHLEQYPLQRHRTQDRCVFQ
jgi:SpoVK/Ycf46/Vps4 family AAA+-type ATPase